MNYSQYLNFERVVNYNIIQIFCFKQEAPAPFKNPNYEQSLLT